jgi:hypothetical protein
MWNDMPEMVSKCPLFECDRSGLSDHAVSTTDIILEEWVTIKRLLGILCCFALEQIFPERAWHKIGQ